MSSNSKNTKSIYVPMLTKKIVKKKSSYMDWERKFRAYAATKDFLEALQGKANLPNQYTDPVTMPVTTEAEKAAKRAVVMNSLGMAFLHQAVESPKGIKLLEKAATDEYPEGIAFDAMTLMKNKFAKIDDLVAVELRRKLNKLKWDDAKEPSEFFEKIASIEIFSNKLTTDRITESELCSQVFCAAPKRHMAALQLVKNDKGANLTVDDLEEKMAEAWRLEHIADDDSDDSSDEDSDEEKEGTEKVLTTQDQGQGNGKKFEGICYKCGKTGHKAFQCHGGRGYAGGRGGRGGGG
jgi:hypothetical protein